MALPSYQFSGAVFPSPVVGSTTFNLIAASGNPIGFLDPAHIRVFTSLDGGASLVERFRPAQWDFNTARTQVILAVPTVANESVVIRRITPLTGPYTVVPDGIVLPADKLRALNLYNLYVSQENVEASQAALTLAQQSNNAINLALATIANQLPYVRYANRAALPTNPGSNQNAEVIDSTNIQTFTPLVFIPAGFIGSPSLVVRLRFNLALTRWEWLDYRSATPDDRYLLKTQVVDSVTSSSTVDPASANAVRIARNAAAAAQTAADNANAAAGNAVATANAAQTAANNAAPLASPQFTGNPRASQLNGGALAGLRNRIINGDFRIDLRNEGAAQLLTAGAALAYTADQWYAFCTGANVNAQRITVGGVQTDPNRYQFNGAVGVTGIGIGQRIEAANTRDLAGRECRLSVSMANSLLTTVTWQVFYANTADTFGTLAAPTRTPIASGTIGVNSTYNRYDVGFTVPSAATTGLEVVFSVAGQTSGTWVVGQVQLEPGDRVTPFEQRPTQIDDLACKRYFNWIPYNLFFVSPIASGSMEHGILFPVEMRVAPTVGAVIADPGTAQANANNSASLVQRITRRGCGLALTASAANLATFVVGFRFSVSAVL